MPTATFETKCRAFSMLVLSVAQAKGINPVFQGLKSQ